MMQLHWIKATCIALVAAGPLSGLAQGPLDAPTEQVLTEARSIVQSMIDNPRGPYARIAWFCADGTVQPPVAYACRDRGGGRQHGEYSEQRQRLEALGWRVGTVFAALSWDEFFDPSHRNQRLRELALERYLTDIDDGWVLRRARSYRGRVQVEGEEARGDALLQQLLGNRDWVADHYLLAREAVRVVPHTGGNDDTARGVRRTAIDLADQDRSFEPLRAEIHGAPTSSTAGRVRVWAATKLEQVRATALGLADDLDSLYGAAGRTARLASIREQLRRGPATASLASRIAFENTPAPQLRLARLADVLIDARSIIVRDSTRAATRLVLFDLLHELETELQVTANEVLARDDLAREDLLRVGRLLFDACHGAGLLTVGEHATLVSEWQSAEATNALSVDEYARLIGFLRRVPQWAVGTVRYTFAEALTRYTALDPRAAAFVDDVLRGSLLVGVAEISRLLSRDLAQLTGVTQNINGHTGSGAFGLNAGVARGRLRIYPTVRELDAGRYTREDIVVLPETVAELEPVAGILTLGEGNPLSHVQLLARNFSIPNIAVLPDMLPLLRPLEHRDVLTGVASDGSVAVLPSDEVPFDLLALITPANQTSPQLTVPRPDLTVRHPIRIAALGAELSGRVVGPKAANLGELARLFPGRVAPALALPFGLFAEQLSRSDIRDRLVEAYALHAAGQINADELGARLAELRRDIGALRLDATTMQALQAEMLLEFGEPGSYGLFIRSDTNVEDLPQFTGAGLSLTVPHVTGQDELEAAIPRVWASVLSPRAIAWRSSLLTNPEEVYASVLLMQSVPSEKSGVMVTTDLGAGAGGLTISTAWGVGGAVGGEAAETIVLHPNGGETLISEAKTSYRRALSPAGGLAWAPAADGAVLAADEKRQLRRLAREVEERYAPVYDAEGRPRPWDIEFGFVDGELTLFQIRPLVERGAQLADRIVSALTPRSDRLQHTQVALDVAPLTD